MRISWFAAIALLFILGTFISVTLEGQFIGADTTSVFYDIMNPDFMEYTNPLTAIGGFFIYVLAWVKGIWAVLWWDYSFFTGSWVVLRYVGWAISTAFVIGLVMAIRGVGSS